MDINLLVLNVGNSRLALGVFQAGELKHADHLDHAHQSNWPGAIRHAWEMIAKTSQPAIAGASVNPALNASIDTMVREITGLAVQWIGHDIDLPIKVCTDQPEKTGQDRILNIAAAHEQMGKACVVVDAGTAITIDVCNDNGDFLGGAIAPGLKLQLGALHDKTAALPSVSPAIPQTNIGRSTEQAILHGVYYGLRGLVKELVENYATELGTWPEIIATGGDAQLLFENWELIHAISPDLTLYGIALAYANHHIDHET
ncbi:MAG: type III pantothenate kinase [Phycisphaerales bacterium]|nr:type III pantothenate kinase [Phycisphaerales bacterium]